MVASLPYLNRTYSQAAPAPLAMPTIKYTPYGGGFGSLPNSRYTTPPLKMVAKAETNMAMVRTVPRQGVGG